MFKNFHGQGHKMSLGNTFSNENTMLVQVQRNKQGPSRRQTDILVNKQTDRQIDRKKRPVFNRSKNIKLRF